MERRFSAFSGVRAERDRSRLRKTDGSGISASPRGNSRARRHDTGLPRARNPNRRDKNGSGCRATGSRQPCTNAATRSGPFAWYSDAALPPGGEAREPWLDSARAPHASKATQTCGPGGESGGGSGALRLAISRATLPSKYSISVRNNAFSDGETALGNAALSIRVDRRSSTSQPSNSARRKRKLSRAVRFTRLRVAARGANFLPTTSPRRPA